MSGRTAVEIIFEGKAPWVVSATMVLNGETAKLSRVRMPQT